MKKYFITLIALLGLTFNIVHGQEKEIYLVVRADDIGMTRAVNRACIDVFTQGIVKTVEIMVPTPWFEEAVVLLNQHPEYDVGVHLTLTSEWQNLKWRPLTHCPSLTDENGYFHPFIWKNKVPGATFLLESKWKLEEIEAELMAQIELAKEKLPQISHFTGHMGCTSANPKIKKVVDKLAKVYDIDIRLDNYNLKRMKGFGGSSLSSEEKTDNFISNLDALTPGVWLFVDHPGYDTEEMKGVGHVGYENVGFDREGVTKAFTSQRVKDAIEENGIKLVSYKEVNQIFNK
jgi:predicted glycoside hydrolase/deacetylase ChbG (UPF0249 family)